MIDSTRSIKACAAYYGENADEMEAYLLDGEKRALELGNRGPIKFDENGDPIKAISMIKLVDGEHVLESKVSAE